MTWLLLVLVGAVLWAFWIWLTNLFDWINEHQHAPAGRREDSSANKERDRSS